MWHEVLRWSLLALALGPFGYYLLAITAARRFFRNRPPISKTFAPPVSVLKPVRGLDREAYENYASFCRQEYPEFEIIFGVTEDTDPAIPIIEKLIHDFPRCKIRLLIGAEQLGTGDKVNKLCRMVREAKHAILIISDSDIRVGPGYLYAVAAPFADPKVGAVTCLYRGITDGTLVSEMEALGNTSDFDAGVLSAWQLGGVDFTLGATMATTKEHLAEIGGFEALVDHFSDDYELGHRIHALGYRIVLSQEPVDTVYPAESWQEAFHRQLRWNMAVRFSKPVLGLTLIFTHGLAWAALVSIIAPAPTIAWFFGCAYIILRGTMAWTVGVWGLKDPLVRKKLWLLPFRDSLAFIVWVLSLFCRGVRWHGTKYYVRNRRLVLAGQRTVGAGA